jgi:hypothetical protein
LDLITKVIIIIKSETAIDDRKQGEQEPWIFDLHHLARFQVEPACARGVVALWILILLSAGARSCCWGKKQVRSMLLTFVVSVAEKNCVNKQDKQKTASPKRKYWARRPAYVILDSHSLYIL